MSDNSHEPDQNVTKPKSRPKTRSPQVTAALVLAIGSVVGCIITGILQIITRPSDVVKEAKVESAALQATIRDLRESKEFPFVLPGTIMAYGGSPNIERLKQFGWLICDGTPYPTYGERGQYTNLFSAIGYMWGHGKTDTNEFRVPDLQGLFLRGVDPDGKYDLDFRTRKNWRGQVVEAVVGSIQMDAIGGHIHNDRGEFVYVSDAPGGKGEALGYREKTHTTSPNLDAASETRPKNAYVYYIIKY